MRTESARQYELATTIAPDNPSYRAILFPMTAELEIELQPAGNRPSEAFLIDLVVNGVTSEHSRRSYKTGLKAFFTWIRLSGAGRAFTKALVQQYRSSLLDQGLSASTVNLRLSPIRKLAREMADNQLLDPARPRPSSVCPGLRSAATGQGTG
ncbi:site-specific integrase [Acidisarcina polymorpha]|uniref:site-specific integrase n=1 Tax=Acidisarcina polymorpha TaxID=2211140 RepID=UPI001F005282|nr:site-specific integrase [Acidisarcina polymorpha]